NFLGVKNENYTIGKYAKLNKFKYKYNDENLKYNDGAIKINNENLPDETIVITSKFYTPDRPIGTFFSGLSSNIYKIWERELKDDSSIEYKELSGRFYCLRYKEITGSFLLTSESLGTNATVTKLPYETYFRLSWNHLIIDNYKSIESIFDKAKAKELLMNLSFQDYEAFNMDKLIYIDKRASYYLVNKIKSFVKGQPTNVEVFEVDYLKEIEKNEPTERYIIITGVTQDACEVTFTIDTNIPQPVEVKLIPHTFTPDGIGGFFYAPYGDPIIVTLESNQIVHTFTELPEQYFGGYKFKVRYDEGIFQLFESNLSELINIPGSCYITPPGLLTYILITNVQTIAILNNGTTRRIRVDYTSDLSIATILLRMYTTNLQFFTGLPIVTENYFAPPSGSFEVEVPHLNFGVLASYSLQIKNAQFNVNSNIATS
ncbi:hypothetical protein, partial [Flavobacterium sp.]|uniref:hypothetical protein n=1 Tax=Flavobacterium sp. TaxID=239 RepID=UPI0025C505B7